MGTPRTVTHRSETGSLPAQMVLRVVEGPDRGKEVRLEQGTLLVGTGTKCQLVLSDPTVSRRHASFALLEGSVRVTDLGSKNGVRYRGARVDTAELPCGGVVQLGGTQLAVMLAGTDESRLSESTQQHGLVARSTAMRQLLFNVERAAVGRSPVLIEGETGVGKELVARVLHALSEAGAGPLVVLECASVQPELLQAALFGHARGAFTGAVKDAEGLIHAAHGGTLLLDKVGELPLALQPLLLRVLETGSVQRVGDDTARSVHVRFLATHQGSLEELVRKRRFRPDLYFRLGALVLRVPPLRQRAEDLPELIEQLCRTRGLSPLSFSPTEMTTLCAYSWPGNVRELANVLEQWGRLGEHALLRVSTPSPSDYDAARRAALHVFERSFLSQLLAQHKGSVSAAAKAAGLGRSYFYELLKSHQLTPNRG